MKVDVLVHNFQGVLEGVRVLSHKKATELWQEWAKRHGYKNYKEFMKAVGNGCREELRWFEDIEIEE